MRIDHTRGITFGEFLEQTYSLVKSVLIFSLPVRISDKQSLDAHAYGRSLIDSGSQSQ